MVFLFKSNNLWDVLAIYCTFCLHGSLRIHIVDACHTVSKDDAIITTILRSRIGLTSIGFNLNYVKKKIIILIVIIYQPVELALRPT